MRLPHSRIFWGSLISVCALVCLGLSITYAQRGESPAPETLMPQNSVIYLGWDGNEAHQATWEKTAAHDSLYKTGAVDVVKKMIVFIAGQVGEDGARAIEVFNQISEKGVSVSVAIPAGEGPPLPSAVVVLHDAAKFEEQVSQVVKEAVGEDVPIVTEKIGSRNVTRGVVPNSPGIEFGWWAEGNHLVVTGGINAVQSTIDVATGKSPNITKNKLWQEYSQQNRFESSMLCWFDVSVLTRQFGPMPIPLPFPTATGEPLTINDVLKKLGLDTAKSVIHQSGFKGRALWSETTVKAPGPKRGLMAFTDQSPISLDDLPPMPPNTNGFYATGFQWSKSYENVLSLLKEVATLGPPGSGQQLDAIIGQSSEIIGFDLERDFFATLGDVTCVYADPNQGFFGWGGAIAIKVKDAKKLRETAGKILELIAQEAGGEFAFRVVPRYGREIIVAEFTEVPFGPAFVIDDDWFVIGLQSQNIETFLLRLDGKLPKWSPSESHKQALAELPKKYSSIMISDPRASVRGIVGMAPMILSFAQMGFNQQARFTGGAAVQFPITASDIPPVELITQPLFPNISVSTVDDEGIHCTSRSSLPSIPLLTGIGGGSGIATTGVLVALLLPAVQQARTAARRSSSSNNLKQIGLSLHNYHDTFRHLPTGTVPNEKLKPEKRLSWFASVLPFIDQAPLHELIDFEEGWDSDANAEWMKTVIPALQNPQNPGAKDSKFGTTHYVGIAGIGKDAAELKLPHKRAGVFGYNRKLRFRDVTDGLSNTVAVSEASKDFGPWGSGGKATIRGLTKKPYINGPDGIGSSFPGGCNMLLLDGSVRFISENIDPSVMESLSTIAGGEIIDQF